MEVEYLVEEYDQSMSALLISSRLNLLSISGWRLLAVVGIRHYFERKR